MYFTPEDKLALRVLAMRWRINPDQVLQIALRLLWKAVRDEPVTMPVRTVRRRYRKSLTIPLA